MFVVRELDRELTFVFRLRGLSSTVRSPKGEARTFARRGAHVTDGANRRAGPDKSLAREKLLPVTAHARVVIRKVCRIGKISLRRPRGWQLVTGVTREALVFVGRVKEGGILCGRAPRSCLGS